MTRERDVPKRHRAELGQRSRALLGAGGLFIAGCSLQDLEYLGYGYGQDGGLSGSLNTSGASGNPGRGGSGSSNGGNGGTQGGTGGASGAEAGGSAGIGGSGSGGTTGGTSAGGSAGTAPINYGGSAGYLGTDPLADGGPDGNLIPDPGFEDGMVGWTGVGGPSLTWTTVGPAAGAHCLRTSGRSQVWMGPSYSLLGIVVPGETYNVAAYARLSHPNLFIKFTIKRLCEGETTAGYDNVVEDAPATTSWDLYEGAFTVPTTCTLTEYRLLAEQAPTGVDIFLDEVRVVPAP